jgi:hypothetical protein
MFFKYDIISPRGVGEAAKRRFIVGKAKLRDPSHEIDRIRTSPLKYR